MEIAVKGSRGHQAIELVQEIGRRIADITADSRETTFLFQRLSVAVQRGNAVSFLGTFPSDLSAVPVIHVLFSSQASGFVLVGTKIIVNNKGLSLGIISLNMIFWGRGVIWGKQ